MKCDSLCRKGAVKPVHIKVERRQGRSTVTLVAGVEYFGLSVDELTEEFKKLCASSVAGEERLKRDAFFCYDVLCFVNRLLTSCNYFFLVTPLVGASPKLQLQEIMVQGPHIKNVSELLLAKGVPKKYVEVMDKTGKYKGENS